MSFPGRRLWALALLVVVAAGLVMPAGAEAAPVRPKHRAGLSRATSGSAAKARHGRRRARRAPPGGVYARNAVVMDPATEQVLYEKNAASAVPIASLTKLMTALVFLEQNPELYRQGEVTQAELQGGGHTRLRNRELVELGDLLRMSLMCSDNVATRVLVRESGLWPEDFLARMNRKALELGLTHTRYVEFTGLDVRNVSTATDVARLLHVAANNDLIRTISTSRSYDFMSDRRAHHLTNTNRLLYGRYQVLGGKTGFIQESGYCLATWIRAEDREMIAVVLGAPTNATRFADVMRLVQRTTSPGFAGERR